jgi:hypothetical protein
VILGSSCGEIRYVIVGKSLPVRIDGGIMTTANDLGERSIAAPDLETAAMLFVSNLPDPLVGPYFVSTDHSPSEQMDDHEWLISALIVSQNMEHQAVADEIGIQVNPNGRSLKQWKASNDAYKGRFRQEIFHVIKDHPVLVFIASARKETILASEQRLAGYLGISECYRRVPQGNKTKVEFGPYLMDNSTVPKTLVVSEKYAPIAIFIAGYLVRLHEFIKSAICKKLDIQDFPFWMQVLSDRPPNDFDGPYAELMWLLLGGGKAQDKFTWGGFTEDDSQPIDLLADNLAGLFHDIAKNPAKYAHTGRELQPPVTGVVCWEQLA